MSDGAAKESYLLNWAPLPSLPQEGFLANFGTIQPKIGYSDIRSPPTSLSIGLESLGDLDSAKDFPQLRPLSKCKNLSSVYLKERAGSMHKGEAVAGFLCNSFVSKRKRKGADSVDLKSCISLGDVSFHEESDVELALGQMGKHSLSTNKVVQEQGENMGGDTNGNLKMSLANGVSENPAGISGYRGREELIASIAIPRMDLPQESVREDSQSCRGAAQEVLHKKNSEESNLLLRLADMDYSNEAGKENSDIFLGSSKQVECMQPMGLELFGSSIQGHSVTDSRSFLTLKESEDLARSFLGLGQAKHQSRTAYEHPPQPTQVPLVDEGSSSASWLKSGGFMPSLLMSKRSYHNVQNAIKLGCTESPGLLSNHDEELSERNLSINMRPSSVTTLISGSSSFLDPPSKQCKFRGCKKGARGASGLCIAHGGGPRCQKHGCNKGAEGRTVYCKTHGGGRRCQYLGCTKSAEGKIDYCIGHGGGRRCSHVNCFKAARGRSGLCIKHGGGKRCQKEGCTKSAEGYTGLCISHGGGRRCQFAGCTKGAQGSTMYCKAHGGGKRCLIFGCTKGAEGSTPLCKGHGGGKRCMFEGGGICTKSVHGGTLFCVAHGGGKRCAISGCSKSARGRTNFCVRHGGGKRCQIEGCGKSAQGSTEFCKAHGGGKRCCWGQEGSAFGPSFIKEGNGELRRPLCDRYARGRLGLCAAHSALVQDRKASSNDVGSSRFNSGLHPGLFQGLVSGSTRNSVGAKKPPCFESEFSGEKNYFIASDKISEGPALSHGMEKGSTAVMGCSTNSSSVCWDIGSVEAFEDRETDLRGKSAPNLASEGSLLEISGSVLCEEKHLQGLRRPVQFSFQLTSPSAVLRQIGLSSDNFGSKATSIVSTSVPMVHPFSQPLLPPQVLVPQCMKQSECNSYGSGSRFQPEGRVHGGGMLVFLASETTEKEDT